MTKERHSPNRKLQPAFVGNCFPISAPQTPASGTPSSRPGARGSRSGCGRRNTNDIRAGCVLRLTACRAPQRPFFHRRQSPANHTLTARKWNRAASRHYVPQCRVAAMPHRLSGSKSRAGTAVLQAHSPDFPDTQSGLRVSHLVEHMSCRSRKPSKHRSSLPQALEPAVQHW